MYTMACPYLNNPVDEGAQILHSVYTTSPKDFLGQINPLCLPDA